MDIAQHGWREARDAFEEKIFPEIPNKYIDQGSVLSAKFSWYTPDDPSNAWKEIFDHLTKLDRSKSSKQFMDSLLSARFDFIGFGVYEDKTGERNFTHYLIIIFLDGIVPDDYFPPEPKK